MISLRCVTSVACLRQVSRLAHATSSCHNVWRQSAGSLVSKEKLNLKTRNPGAFSIATNIRLYSDDASVSSRIEKMVKNNKVVVFMKGIPDQPMCGFSNAVVQVLRMHGVENYDAHNVLEDDELRQGIKDFSDWPTIPQVYFDGEFVGGCDIMLQMHQNGDIIEELQKIGIESAIAKD